ncbi:MAG: RluA family pseudouridine synthase [Clostridia bacterium]
MRSFRVPEKSDQKPIDKAILNEFKYVPKNSLFKALRNKDVKVNGGRVRDNYVVHQGDLVEVYLTDAILFGETYGPGFSAVFEDEHFLIVNKEPGVPSLPEKDHKGISLIERVRETFPNVKYELCHRLDRNTEGLVILAKDTEAKQFIIDKMKHREILKHYKCTVVGRPKKKTAECKAFIYKDEKKGLVYVSETKNGNAKEAITRYRVLGHDDRTVDGKVIELTLLEVQILTGRTHQIRAHLAFEGFPLLGDGKYGNNEINRKLKQKSQVLQAFKLVFAFSEDKENPTAFDYLSGRTFQI